jgi:predicted RND superfamily exporter protein
MALIFGFSVMGLSTFKPLILFGVLMIVTMVATTIGALLVLPCAIKLTNVSLVKKTA